MQKALIFCLLKNLREFLPRKSKSYFLQLHIKITERMFFDRTEFAFHFTTAVHTSRKLKRLKYNGYQEGS